MARDLEAEIGASIDRVASALADPSDLLDQLGAIVASASRRAFHDQKLGDTLWEPRYPSQAAPFLNIAGALQDFNAGRAKPKPVRFQNRPALVDEGQRGGLMGSITYKATDHRTVEIGSTKPYANRMQFGGETTIQVSGDAVKRAYDWLYTKRGQVRKGLERQAKRLSFLFDRDLPWESQTSAEYTVRNVPRPFLGVTPELAEDLAKTVQFYLERKARA